MLLYSGLLFGLFLTAVLYNAPESFFDMGTELDNFDIEKKIEPYEQTYLDTIYKVSFTMLFCYIIFCMVFNLHSFQDIADFFSGSDYYSDSDSDYDSDYNSDPDSDSKSDF